MAAIANSQRRYANGNGQHCSCTCEGTVLLPTTLCVLNRVYKHANGPVCKALVLDMQGWKAQHISSQELTMTRLTLQWGRCKQ